MSSLGTLTLDLVARTSNYIKGLTQAERASKRFAATSIRNAKIIGGAFAGIAGIGLKEFISNTKALEQGQAQLAAVIRSTGSAAGFTVAEMNRLGESLSKKTVFSTGEITKAQTVLLAYSGIVGDQLVKAQKAAADMATRTGMSIASAAETVGRALDIPSQGMAALSRQGFRFTQEQKELIKQLESTGDVAAAQNIILEELEASYGGAAEAARDTLGGSLDALRNTIGELLTGSTDSLSGVTAAVNALNKALSSTHAQAAIKATGYAVSGLAVIIASRLVPSVVASGVSFAAARLEAIRYQVALARMAGASRVAAASLAVLGGPVGVAITAAAAVAYFGAKASITKKEAKDLDERIAALGDSFDKLSVAQATAALVDYETKLEKVREEAAKADKQVEQFKRVLEVFPDSAPTKEWERGLSDAKGAAATAKAEVERLTASIEQLKNVASGIAPAGAVNAAGDAVSEMYAKLERELRERLATAGLDKESEKLAARIREGFIEGLRDGEGEMLVSLAREIEAIEESRRKTAEAASVRKRAAEEAARANAARLKSIQDVISAQEREVAIYGKTAGEVKLYDLELQGAKDSQLRHLKTLIDSVSVMEEKSKIDADYLALVKSLRTEEERRSDTLREQIDLIRKSGAAVEEQREMAIRAAKAALDVPAPTLDFTTTITGELFNLDEQERQLDEWRKSRFEALEKSREEYYELSEYWNAKELDLYEEFAAKQRMIDLQRVELSAKASQDIFGTLAESTKKLFGESSGAYRALFAMEKAANIARATVAMYTAISLAAASKPFPANFAAMASVATAVAGLVSSIAAVGIAHDGIDSVPKTGTWLLEKGERVMTEKTSKRLDKTLDDIKDKRRGGGSDNIVVNVIEDSSKAGKTEDRQVDEKTVIDIFVSNIMSDGRAAGAMERKYGMTTVGR